MLYDEEGQILAWLMSISYKASIPKYIMIPNLYGIMIRKLGMVSHSSSTMYGTLLKVENFTFLAVFKLQMLYPQSFQPINNILGLILLELRMFYHEWLGATTNSAICSIGISYHLCHHQ